LTEDLTCEELVDLLLILAVLKDAGQLQGTRQSLLRVTASNEMTPRSRKELLVVASREVRRCSCPNLALAAAAAEQPLPLLQQQEQEQEQQQPSLPGDEVSMLSERDADLHPPQHSSSSTITSRGSMSPQSQRCVFPKCRSYGSVSTVALTTLLTSGSVDGNGTSEVDTSLDTPRHNDAEKDCDSELEDKEDDGTADEWELEFILRSTLAEIWAHLKEGAMQKASLLIDDACREISQYQRWRRREP
jgi:hypothetical protein